MDKSCPYTGGYIVSSTNSINPPPPIPLPTAATTRSGSSDRGSTNHNRDQYLRHLNKLSHKISKPTTATINTTSVTKPSFESCNQIAHHQQTPLSQSLAQQQQNQPPVYNINKDDFRDVVQKLTGSPAHERISNPTTQPPPVQAPKPASSRLQRIRPPPLAQINNRPSPLINSHMPPQTAFYPAPIGHSSCGFSSGGGLMGHIRPSGTPLSPLPPLPSCHAAAESPVSAYMRFLHNSVTGAMGVDSDKRFSGIPPPLASPNYKNQTSVNHLMQNQPIFPSQQHRESVAPPPSSSSSLEFVMPPPPSSPLPFGCFLSPKSPCPLLSPTLPFSPTGTFPFSFSPFPLSPGVPPVPSPK